MRHRPHVCWRGGQASPPPPPSPVGTRDTPVRPSPLLGGSRPRGPPTVWWERPQPDTARPPPRCWLARRGWGEARGRLCPLRYRCLGTGWARGFVVHETCPRPRCTHTHRPPLQRGLSLLWGATPRSGSKRPPASPWHSAAPKLAVHTVLSPSTLLGSPLPVSWAEALSDAAFMLLSLHIVTKSVELAKNADAGL